MNARTSCHLKEGLLIDISKRFAKIQNEGILDKYVEAEISVAKEKNVKVCDIGKLFTMLELIPQSYYPIN